ncbi:MAG: MoaD/ThiS family protein [Planctomycetes bacterium]|nr:MoaD/ThiS family protein [Planctomycetota bacterium]
MRLTIVYTTQLKAALGTGTESVDIAQPKTTADLLIALAEKHGEEFRRLALDSAGRPLPSLLICVGDEQIAPAAPLSLKDGDTITILSAISGG